MSDELGPIHSTMSFLGSVIRSGEPFTPHVEQAIANAHTRLDAAADRIEALKAERSQLAVLGQFVGEVLVELGGASPMPLTGPQLMLLLDDLKNYVIELSAERDTLAEMVRLLDVRVLRNPDPDWSSVLESFDDGIVDTDQAERFQRVLDQLQGGQNDE